MLQILLLILKRFQETYIQGFFFETWKHISFVTNNFVKPSVLIRIAQTLCKISVSIKGYIHTHFLFIYPINSRNIRHDI